MLEDQCHKAVDHLIARYAWRLIDRETFIHRTLALLSTNGASDAHRAATYIYSQALYQACAGNEGQARQEQGYTELHRYLDTIARWRYQDDGEEAAQHALEATYMAIGRCRAPGTFLAFALGHLQNAIKAIRRLNMRTVQSLDRPLRANAQSPTEQLADERTNLADEAIARVWQQERQALLRQCLEAFQQSNPRAKQQLAALWLKYIDGLDDLTIGQRLGTTVENVHVLRARAVKKLRQLPCWRELAMVEGLLPDES